ncbi:putative tetratricopeptide repeat protein 28 [Rosellinia necatrix]|uniref:Putative tetratricopeptide repeat protein 28 n=1 Tax=Rosellinia necatrix TaxID=77044 RepID=A0A1W2TWE2_ROSNE|nr:putative tetratricopeptide repeat protein 28 [Rosellinia necatrix]
MCATFFLFDSQRGFQSIASALGPVAGREYYQERDPGATTPAMLAVVIEAFRSWEQFYQKGLSHTREGELEEALLSHRSALSICDGTRFLQETRYRYMVLAELGYAYRMLGRYLKASECLEEMVQNMPHNNEHLKATGELAVVYRQLGKLHDSKRACEEQYETARHLGSELEMSRAIGNLGMVNYQLFLLHHRQEDLDIAIDQLDERVDRCQRLRKAATSLEESSARAAEIQSAVAREAIAFARLSLCHTARGDIDKAIDTVLECQRLSLQSGDPNGYTPVAALSKEPSEEHRGYIREMIDAGADLTARDESGYSALDYAVYNGDKLTQNLLMDAFRRGLSLEEVEEHRMESVLRKGYRELFQDKLRPVLLQPDKQFSIKQLRQVYAKILAIDWEKAAQFDTFKYVRYTDFLRFGKLPKSNDNLTRRIEDDPGADDYIIFISYTWAKKRGGQFSPDDPQNTKYHTMTRAVESFLQTHSTVDRRAVCIWIDWACIDQIDRAAQARGVAALPMCIAQCNAMISIVDHHYYDRAWCCVEVVTIRALQRSYDAHRWFEYEKHVGGGKGVLRDGRLLGKPLNVALAGVTLESDRPKLRFLERQAKLLDNAVGT